MKGEKKFEIQSSHKVTSFFTQDEEYFDALKVVSAPATDATQLANAEKYLVDHDLFAKHPNTIGLNDLCSNFLGFEFDLSNPKRIAEAFRKPEFLQALKGDKKLLEIFDSVESEQAAVTLFDMTDPGLNIVFFVALSGNTQFVDDFISRLESSRVLKGKLNFNAHYTEHKLNLLFCAVLLRSPQLFAYFLDKKVNLNHKIEFASDTHTLFEIAMIFHTNAEMLKTLKMKAPAAYSAFINNITLESTDSGKTQTDLLSYALENELFKRKDRAFLELVEFCAPDIKVSDTLRALIDSKLSGETKTAALEKLKPAKAAEIPAPTSIADSQQLDTTLLAEDDDEEEDEVEGMQDQEQPPAQQSALSQSAILVDDEQQQQEHSKTQQSIDSQGPILLDDEQQLQERSNTQQSIDSQGPILVDDEQQQQEHSKTQQSIDSQGPILVDDEQQLQEHSKTQQSIDSQGPILVNDEEPQREQTSAQQSAHSQAAIIIDDEPQDQEQPPAQQSVHGKSAILIEDGVQQREQYGSSEEDNEEEGDEEEFERGRKLRRSHFHSKLRQIVTHVAPPPHATDLRQELELQHLLSTSQAQRLQRALEFPVDPITPVPFSPAIKNSSAKRSPARGRKPKPIITHDITLNEKSLEWALMEASLDLLDKPIKAQIDKSSAEIKKQKGIDFFKLNYAKHFNFLVRNDRDRAENLLQRLIQIRKQKPKPKLSTPDYIYIIAGDPNGFVFKNNLSALTTNVSVIYDRSDSESVKKLQIKTSDGLTVILYAHNFREGD